VDETDPGCRSPDLRVPVRLVVATTFALWILPAARAQQAVESSPLTLRQAVEIALAKNPLRAAAVADTKEASAGVREARSVFMPRLTFSETATRGNDPVYVFGSKLRQQRFNAADFFLNKLNTPLPFGSFSTRFGGSWNLFDSFASWHSVNRAKHMNEAAGHQLERTDQEIVFRVIEAYYGVLLVNKQLEVARARGEAVSVHHGSQSVQVRQWPGRRVRSADRESANSRAKAGADPSQEQPRFSAGTVEHRDGCAYGHLVPAG